MTGKDKFGFGRKTESAGTAIAKMIPGKQRKRTYLTRMVYRAAGTAHAITVMRRIAETTLSAAAAASQAVIALTADPGTIAANDHLAIKKPDGSWHHGIVSSVSSLNITLTANVPTGGFSSGARVIFYGVVSDTEHADMVFTGTASVITSFPPSGEGTLCVSPGVDQPLIVSSDNLTNAGFIEELAGHYEVAG